jgi:hypothetical protein
VAGIAERLAVRTGVEDELAEIQEDVSPEAVLDALQETEEAHAEPTAYSTQEAEPIGMGKTKLRPMART